MELNELEKNFNNQGVEVQAARERLFSASEKVIIAREKLESAKMAALQSGRIDGKNDTERKTQLFAATGDESILLEIAERNERQARYEFDTAMFAFDILRYRLRIAELSK